MTSAADNEAASAAPKKVLHVGCGHLSIANMTRGFQDGTWQEVRFDIDPNVSPDIIGTITDMSAIADASVDAIYSSHNIEHVETFEVVPTLREFRRVLADDGFAAITCPDIETIASVIAEGRIDEPLYQSTAGPISPLDVVYGFGADIQRGRHYMAHRTAFTRETLSKRIREAGFASVIVAQRPSRYDLWAIATKTQTSEEGLRALIENYGLR
ncbi:MAG: methyltransferase domain-containing protein [Sphingomonas bacterium]|nr:methyltransferase domain-containing protein [Sphingomonas bacterium]